MFYIVLKQLVLSFRFFLFICFWDYHDDIIAKSQSNVENETMMKWNHFTVDQGRKSAD